MAARPKLSKAALEQRVRELELENARLRRRKVVVDVLDVDALSLPPELVALLREALRHAAVQRVVVDALAHRLVTGGRLRRSGRRGGPMVSTGPRRT